MEGQDKSSTRSGTVMLIGSGTVMLIDHLEALLQALVWRELLGGERRRSNACESFFVRQNVL